FIPRMRFVQVAFATDGKQVKDPEINMPKPPRSAFLVEECIDGRFRKYINNRQPVPSTNLKNSDDITCASFLAFTQHWQFKRTHGLAFVSDYQGGDDLLTDPQIMSDASLGHIFGNGNMAAGCRDFATAHQCNEYCKFFGIDK
ncbi:alpha-kinase family-domain-containing protein, partial [Mycena maculata]